jgi:hypothetical protein
MFAPFRRKRATLLRCLWVSSSSAIKYSSNPPHRPCRTAPNVTTAHGGSDGPSEPSEGQSIGPPILHHARNQWHIAGQRPGPSACISVHPLESASKRPCAWHGDPFPIRRTPPLCRGRVLTPCPTISSAAKRDVGETLFWLGRLLTPSDAISSAAKRDACETSLGSSHLLTPCVAVSSTAKRDASEKPLDSSHVLTPCDAISSTTKRDTSETPKTPTCATLIPAPTHAKPRRRTAPPSPPDHSDSSQDESASSDPTRPPRQAGRRPDPHLRRNPAPRYRGGSTSLPFA